MDRAKIAEEAARGCAYAASNYFDQLYLKHDCTKGSFTSAGTNLADMKAAFLPAIQTALEKCEGELNRLREVERSLEEREAAVCPEDVSFDDHIRFLQSQLTQLREENERLRASTLRACVMLQQGSDIEVAAERIFEINQSNQNEVIRLTADNTTLRAQVDRQCSRSKVEAHNCFMTGCGARFSIFDSAAWKFCPTCGGKIASPLTQLTEKGAGAEVRAEGHLRPTTE